MRLLRGKAGADLAAEATEAGLRAEVAQRTAERDRALDRAATVLAPVLAPIDRTEVVAAQLEVAAQAARARAAEDQREAAVAEADALRVAWDELASELDAVRGALAAAHAELGELRGTLAAVRGAAARRPAVYQLPSWAYQAPTGASRSEKWALWQAKDELARAAARIAVLEGLLDEVAAR